MEKSNDSSSSKSDHNDPKQKQKEIWVLISSIQNISYIHTSIKNPHNHNEDKLDSNSNDSYVRSSLENILDVNLSTRGKDTLQIKLMAINSVLWKIDEQCISEIREEIKEENKEINNSNHLEWDDDPFNLQNRNFNEKLTCDQIRFLRYWIDSKNLSIKKLSQRYWISPSALYKIKNQKSSDILKGPARAFVKMQISERRVLVKAIKDIIENIDYSFNAVEITKLINEKLQSDYSWTLVRNLMKTDLNLSFKRVQPRPNSINLNRVKAIRQLFILKFLNEITTDYLIINIDETSINRHIRTNYSWCLKGTSKEVVNSPFSGSLSMISSICTNGNWISFIVNNTIDWQKFMTYLDHLYKWLKANKNFGFKNIAIILDNWSIHKTQKVKIKLNKMFSKTIYLPP